jgi:hypothetical protein
MAMNRRLKRQNGWPSRFSGGKAVNRMSRGSRGRNDLCPCGRVASSVRPGIRLTK